MPVAIEPHQPLEVRQEAQRAATLGGGDPLRDLAHAVLVEHAVDETRAIQLPRRTFDFPVWPSSDRL